MTNIRFKRNAFFLPSSSGQLFCLHYMPEKDLRSHVLIFPPFAEELNKCRRLLSTTASLLARSGFSVMLVDLYGTGDSEGNFEQSSWNIWKSDMYSAISFLLEYQNLPINFLTVRLGTLLAFDLLNDEKYKLPSISNFVAWQPIFNTQKYLKQFLRIQLVANLLSSTPIKTTEAIKKIIYQDGQMEIGGYPFSALLMDEILSLCISTGQTYDLEKISSLVLIQITTGSTNVFSEDIQNFLLDASETREKIKIRLLKGSPFWQAQEQVEIPELSKLSLENFLHG